MTEGAQVQPDGGPFGAIDPKLTVFALANGMDLVKDESSRQLTWFTEGFERGLRVEVTGADSFVVTALAWRINAPDDASEALFDDDVDKDDLTGTLERAIESANAIRMQ